LQELLYARRSITYCGTCPLDFDVFSASLHWYDRVRRFLYVSKHPDFQKLDDWVPYQLRSRTLLCAIHESGAAATPSQLIPYGKWLYVRLAYRNNTKAARSYLPTSLNRDELAFAYLEFSRFFDATDPRDHIFAMYSLIQDSNSRDASMKAVSLPAPDYDKGVAVVYEETARELILQTGYLDIFLLESRLDKDLGLPSWVPNFGAPKRMWHCEADYSMRWLRVSKSLSPAQATSNSQIDHVTTANPLQQMRLRLKGKRLAVSRHTLK
jgi:hypothetical protein